MSLEWARIEPQEGRFDEEALSHYRREIELLRARDIRPLVTLHHFSNPLWMEDSGAFEDSRAVDRFARYTERAVAALGDLVSDWVTINEPNIYTLFGYVFGDWPPGKTDLAAARRVAGTLARAHAAAYRIIHDTRAGPGPTAVGVAHHLRLFEPARSRHPADRMVAGLYDRVFQDMFVRATTEGERRWPLGKLDLPAQRNASGYLVDFFGINYYSRDLVRARVAPAELFGRREVAPGAPTSDLGWELYPRGLAAVATRYWERYGLPIFVTENGIADAADSRRIPFIASHLSEIARAVADGVDIRRYYHWSLMDNFEWVEGLTPRFGLVEIDYETQARQVRESGRFYAEVCVRGGVDEELIERYGLG